MGESLSTNHYNGMIDAEHEEPGKKMEILEIFTVDVMGYDQAT